MSFVRRVVEEVVCQVFCQGHDGGDSVVIVCCGRVEGRMMNKRISPPTNITRTKRTTERRFTHTQTHHIP